MVKRWTEGQSHFQVVRRDPKCETEGFPGKNYVGILVKDFAEINPWEDDHFRFIENPPSVSEKRNPRVFDGRFITITRRADGSLRPNLKPVKIEDGFDVDDYATGVANELLHALSCLVEE